MLFVWKRLQDLGQKQPAAQQSSATALFPWRVQEGVWRHGNVAVADDCSGGGRKWWNIRLDKWPETQPNRNPSSWNGQWSPLDDSELRSQSATRAAKMSVEYISLDKSLKTYLTEARLLKMVIKAPYTTASVARNRLRARLKCPWSVLV